MKRFYKQASVTAEPGGHAIHLDGRPVRTPARAPLLLPNAPLAEAIAAEWNAQGEEISPATMPMTGFANAAIDQIAVNAANFATGIAAYGESDLLCYRADSPALLVQRQNEQWNPLLDWAERTFGVEFALASGVMHVPQPTATLDRLRGAVLAHDPFMLAGLSTLVTLTGSLVCGLALAQGDQDSDAVWQASELDELWQVEQWGEDAQAADRRSARRREFDAAVTFCKLASPDGPVSGRPTHQT